MEFVPSERVLETCTCSSHVPVEKMDSMVEALECMRRYFIHKRDRETDEAARSGGGLLFESASISLLCLTGRASRKRRNGSTRLLHTCRVVAAQHALAAVVDASLPWTKQSRP